MAVFPHDLILLCLVLLLINPELVMPGQKIVGIDMLIYFDNNPIFLQFLHAGSNHFHNMIFPKLAVFYLFLIFRLY